MTLSKSDFIRQHPDEDSDSVVAKAKEIGIEITRDSVHKIRSADRIKAKTASKTRKKPVKEAKVFGAVKKFILSQPMDMPVEEIRSLAEKAGLKPPHPVYVSAVRGQHRKNTKKTERRKPGSSKGFRKGISKTTGTAITVAEKSQPIPRAKSSSFEEILGKSRDIVMREALKLGLNAMINELTYARDNL